MVAKVESSLFVFGYSKIAMIEDIVVVVGEDSYGFVRMSAR
jgi:hypothetical protein